MRKMHWLETAAIALLLVAPSGDAVAETITEDFSTFNGQIWQAGTYGNPGSFTVESLGGELHLKKQTVSGGSPVKGGGLYSKFILSGDFRITVDFRWTIYSENNQAQINLSSVTTGFFYDMGTGKGVDVPTGQRLYYNFIPSDGHLLASARVNTNDDSGTLRVERSGNTYRAYYSSDGTTFTQIPGTRFLTTGDVRFSLILQNNNIDNVAEVFYDNLEVVADQILCSGSCVMPGEVSGQVVADCPQTSGGLQGVTVDAYEVGSGDLAGSTTTDETGSYVIGELLPGDYTITTIVPLGYSAPANDVLVSVHGGGTVAASFEMTCITVSGDPRGTGFWKHQVGVAVGGKGKAQVDSETLCGLLDSIEEHFNNNTVNAVQVYEPPVSGACEDKLQVASGLLNLHGNVGELDRARQHFMAMLLNVADARLHLAAEASEDGATVSQVVTYVDGLVDDPLGDHGLAKSISATVNDGQLVQAGVIPLSTAEIAYKSQAGVGPPRFVLGQNEPNPFNPSTTISMTLPAASAYRLEIYSVSGRLVRQFQGHGEAGEVQVHWDGRDQFGNPLASGVFFYRGQVGNNIQQKRMLLLK